MLQAILALNPLTKNHVIAFLLTANVIAIAFVMTSRDQMKKTLAMYEHPAVIHETAIKRVAGPVRIVEHVVEKPGGERVVERTIYRDAVVTTKESASSSTPIAPAMSSSERYLVGGSWETSFDHPKNVTAWAGYSFGRLDLLGGVGLKQGDISGHLMVVTRWGK